MSKENTQNLFQEIISHCKEYGFIFPSSEIYDGLSAVYDYGPYGIELKKNIQEYWWKCMVQLNENIVGLDREAGLRRVLGKPQRYAAMLRGFVDAQADTIEHIRKALARGDGQTAVRLAHTLKGLAGNIAASKLVLDPRLLRMAEVVRNN